MSKITWKKTQNIKHDGCVLFIIPRAYEKIDPVSDRLFKLHGITSIIHRHPSVLDSNEMIDQQIMLRGKIHCVVYPDDPCFCDEWFSEDTSNKHDSFDELLNIIKSQDIPIVPLSMEWGGVFEDQVEFVNPSAAYREILVVIRQKLSEEVT